MALKQDLRKSFEDNLKNGGEISDISKLITDSYKKAVTSGMDLLANKWTGINYNIIQKGIEAQFTLSFNTQSNLKFNLIESALVSAWSSALLNIPAIPAPGMSLVISGSVVSSILPGTLPLANYTDNYNNIVNSFFNMFTKHASSLSFLYVGSSISVPTIPIVIPITSFTIK